MDLGGDTGKAQILDYLPPENAERFRLTGIDGVPKRAFDLGLASLVALFTLPLMLVVALAIKLQDGGPVFYRQERCGRAGRAFLCYKFRSMRIDADRALEALLAADPTARREWEETQKLQRDPRVTLVGRFLRKSSLDELPQLINILAGEMSLIGPRPVTYAELTRYGDNLKYYLAARPGVTGLWQVNGRNHLTYEERVEFDAEYVRDWSFGRDMMILVRTVPAVLLSDGAY